MKEKQQKRTYRKRKRANQEEETRRRITEAVVELHRTVGPANTKVTEVAELAGVSRMTVYNHFPDEADLIEACSSHWASENPFPDPGGWAEEEAPPARLRKGLNELYAWYRTTEDMMGKVLRDAPLVPALGEIMGQRWWPYVEWMVATFAEGWEFDTHRGDELKPIAGGGEALQAALRLAVDFQTWKTLDRSGLSDEKAAELMAGMVECGRSLTDL
jgi:AcrR family transcriptional regulator